MHFAQSNEMFRFTDQLELMTKASSTSIRFRFQTQLFLRGLAIRPHVSVENGDQNCIFSKTLSKVEFFKTAVFVFTGVGD